MHLRWDKLRIEEIKLHKDVSVGFWERRDAHGIHRTNPVISR